MNTPLKLTVKATKQLRDDHGIDLMSGANVALEDIDTVTAIYLAASQHNEKQPTAEEVGEMHLMDLVEAVGVLLSEAMGKRQPAKKAAKRTARKKAKR